MGINSDGTTLIDQGLFENIGAITWDTTVKTSDFTAVSSNGYFCNTTSAAFTVTLPASPSAGDVVAIADYANTFDTNNVTIGRNGSNIQGEAEDFTAEIEGLSITLIYVDGTQGWLSIDAAQASDIISPQFLEATGGTVTTSGDFKIHTFTSPGTFEVTTLSTESPAPAYNTVSYTVVGGGGGGASRHGGAGGAGGFREGKNAPIDSYTASPLNAPAGISVSVTSYPIAVGAGGAGAPGPCEANGSAGVASSGLGISSAGGGRGTSGGDTAGSGGSGGGGGMNGAVGSGGSGNTPPVSPPQGNLGRPGGVAFIGGAGGGATVAGSTPIPCGGAAGGAGATTSISASPTAYAGGGGGGSYNGAAGGSGGAGGIGGGGAGGGDGCNAVSGTTNTGGGGGGGASGPGPSGIPGNAGSGGSGIVIIRYKFQ